MSIKFDRDKLEKDIEKIFKEAARQPDQGDEIVWENRHKVQLEQGHKPRNGISVNESTVALRNAIINFANKEGLVETLKQINEAFTEITPDTTPVNELVVSLSEESFPINRQTSFGGVVKKQRTNRKNYLKGKR